MRDATGYHDLVVQLPDVGLIVTDRDMRVVLAAGEALLHVGWRADELVGHRLGEEQVAQLNAELEGRVRQRTAELDEANRNLESFTYTVSHDLRAPLTALSGTVEVLSEEYASQLSGAGLDHLARIQTVTGRMDRLIGDLLALSQASSAEIHLARVDLSRLAHDVVTALREHDPGRQVETLIEDGVHVQGDERLLCTVMDNLLGNAWKFTARTPQARIEFATVPAAHSTVHCCVRDNGTGFEPASAAQLFRPFSRLHPDQGLPRHRDRPCQRPAHPRTPPRPVLGRGPARSRRHIPLHAARR